MRALYESRAAQWGAAVLVAAVLCCSYPLMYVYRAVWQSQEPQLAAQWANNGRFTMLAVFGGEHVEEEVIYAARLREAAEHLVPYDAFVNENRSPRILIADYLTHRIMALPFLVFRNIDATWFFWRLTCGVLWFMLIYRLALRATASAAQALFCGVFVTCFSYLLTFLFVSNLQWSGNPLQVLLHNGWTVLSYGRTEGILRLPRPGFTYMALYLACHLAIRAVETNQRRWIAASGVVGGLLAYVRPDVWSMYLGTMGAFAAVQSFRKRKLDKGLFASLGLSLLLSLPFIWAALSIDHETARRTGMAHQTAYQFSSWVYLAGCGILLRYRREPVHAFLASMLGFMFVFLNAPLILGFQIEPDHWKYIANIFFFIAIVSLLPPKWKRPGRAWEALAAALLAVCFLQGASFAALHYPFFGLPRDIQGGLDWLDHNAKPDSVVLSLDPEINCLVPAMTHSKDLIAPFSFALVSDLPVGNNVERIRYGLKMLGADEKRFVRETFLEGPIVGRQNFTTADRKDAQTILLLNMAIGFSRKDYAALFKSDEPIDNSGFAGPDYVWVGPFERQYAADDVAGRNHWTPVYQSGTVALYKTKP